MEITAIENKMYDICEIDIVYRPMFKMEERKQICSSLDVYDFIKKAIKIEDQNVVERFYVVALNNSNRILWYDMVSEGGITGTMVDIRLVMSRLLKSLSTAFICWHNHPSGKMEPSSADRDITEKLKKAAGLFDIKLLDHLIINSEGRFYSFSDEGLL